MLWFSHLCSTQPLYPLVILMVKHTNLIFFNPYYNKLSNWLLHIGFGSYLYFLFCSYLTYKTTDSGWQLHFLFSFAASNSGIVWDTPFPTNPLCAQSSLLLFCERVPNCQFLHLDVMIFNLYTLCKTVSLCCWRPFIIRVSILQQQTLLPQQFWFYLLFLFCSTLRYDL
jgi:hypothetical protein